MILPFFLLVTVVNGVNFNQSLYRKLVDKWNYVLEDHFRPFARNGVTSELFSRTLEGGSHVIFQSLNGLLTVSDPQGYCFCNKTHYSPDLKFGFHLRRCQAMATILSELDRWTRELGDRDQLPNYEFVWSLDDLPVWTVKPIAGSGSRGPLPGFGAVRCWSKGSLAMPFFGSHLDFNFSDFDRRGWNYRRTHLRQRQGKVIFRGGVDRGCSFERDTILNFDGDSVFARRSEKDHCGRAHLLEQAKLYPSLVSYGGNNDTWITLDDQESNYRYVLSVEGFGGWTDRLSALFRRSMVVFDQDHPCDQWFEPTLKPYVHYVPVANDFRNLAGRVVWANSHPNLVEEIWNSAEEWSDQYLSPTGILSFMYASISRYTKLVRYPVEARGGAVPLARLWDQSYIHARCM